MRVMRARAASGDVARAKPRQSGSGSVQAIANDTGNAAMMAKSFAATGFTTTVLAALDFPSWPARSVPVDPVPLNSVWDNLISRRGSLRRPPEGSDYRRNCRSVEILVAGLRPASGARVLRL